MRANRSSVPRWFRTLLWLLPFAVRSDRGREMTQVFTVERREIGEHRRLAQVGLWLRTSWGLLREAPAAHAAIARHDAVATFRSMRRAPALTLTVLLTLGLGIAAATTMFSVVDAVLLRPLPYPGANALVSIKEQSLKNPGERGSDVSYPAFLDLGQQTRTLEHVAAFRFEEVVLRGGAEPIREFAARVSPELFSVLGVQ